MNGLQDIRGYDGVDPGRLMDLFKLAGADSDRKPKYAQAQLYKPRSLAFDDDGCVVLAPILDLLNVEHVVFKGTPPEQARPVFQSPGFWVLSNRRALPRAFVPLRAEMVTNQVERLERLGQKTFNPWTTAYVEAPIDLPNECDGSAEVVSETPTRLEIIANMKTRGLLVLSELWDPGWRAYSNEKQIPVLRVNHALQGIVLDAFTQKVVFRYEPATLRAGFQMSGLGALFLAGISMYVYRRRERWLPIIQESVPRAKVAYSGRGPDKNQLSMARKLKRKS
jgi:hypothetical protein